MCFLGKFKSHFVIQGRSAVASAFAAYAGLLATSPQRLVEDLSGKASFSVLLDALISHT